MLFWILLSFVLFVLLMVQTVRAYERGMLIEDLSWDHDLVERERDLKEDWRYRADAANHHKKHWRRRARQQKAIIEHLERERHGLNNQLHWMAIAYERLTDAIFKNQPQGRVLVTDLRQNSRQTRAMVEGSRQPWQMATD